MQPRAPEGVSRFECAHTSAPLDARRYEEAARALTAWRELLARLRVLGQDPARYEGYGYGNVSMRASPLGGAPRGQRPFLISGTQTGGKPRLTLDDFCVVERWNADLNQVTSRGLVPPSSESLTHGALYDIAPDARVVLHAHSPEIWRQARALRIPVSDPAIANGTPAMAMEVQRLYRESTLSSVGILAMGGHLDGVLAFGRTAELAGETLVRHLARALELGGA